MALPLEDLQPPQRKHLFFMAVPPLYKLSLPLDAERSIFWFPFIGGHRPVIANPPSSLSPLLLSIA